MNGDTNEKNGPRIFISYSSKDRKVVPEDRLLAFRISNWGVADMDVSLFDSKSEWQQLIKLLHCCLLTSALDYAPESFLSFAGVSKGLGFCKAPLWGHQKENLSQKVSGHDQNYPRNP